MKRILFAPDGEGGGGGQEAQTETTAPPAARTVVNGPNTEDTLRLQQQLESERSEKKKREQRINDLEDENHRLRQVQSAPPAQRPPWRYRPVKRTPPSTNA